MLKHKLYKRGAHSWRNSCCVTRLKSELYSSLRPFKLGKTMAEEKDVLEFLKPRDGKASLNEITEGLGMPKYGPNSVYALLQSLKTKGVIERRGEQWILIGEATAVPTPSPPQTPPPVEGVTTTQARTGSIYTYK